MTGPARPPDDADLMAWVDGELDPAQADRVAAAVRDDPALAARAQALRDLTRQLRHAFDDTLQEPVPPALEAAARGPRATTTADTLSRVVSLDAVRAGRRGSGPPRFTRLAWGGLAAGLLVGLVVLLQATTGGERGARPADGTVALLASVDGRTVAAGPLAEALQRRLAAEEAPPDPGGAGSGALRVPLTFRDRDGRFCRAFTAEAVGSGLACRDGDRWVVELLAAPVPASVAGPSPAGPDRLRLASSALPPAVLDAVDRRIAGLALDADQERAARDAGWSR